MDLVKHGIRVNSLTPTATDPRRVRSARSRGAVPGRSAGAGCSTSPKWSRWACCRARSHYARAVVFLASDDAEMITGFDLRVDAGAIAKYWPWIPNA